MFDFCEQEVQVSRGPMCGSFGVKQDSREGDMAELGTVWAVGSHTSSTAIPQYKEGIQL